MLGAVAHVGITVRDMDKAVEFYRDTLGLKVIGDVTIDGQEASTVTQVPNTTLRAVYLRYKDDPTSPPIELLHFIEPGETGKPYPAWPTPASPRSPSGSRTSTRPTKICGPRGGVLFGSPAV